nr:cupin domain-containing protein [Saliphagus sp. LR7]
MMSYTKVNYEETETSHGMHFLRDELECTDHGFTVVDAEPGWEGPEHEHDDQDHEEVYFLVDGEATVTIDNDDDVSLEPGDAVRIPPDATRQIVNGDTDSQIILTGAP